MNVHTSISICVVIFESTPFSHATYLAVQTIAIGGGCRACGNNIY